MLERGDKNRQGERGMTVIGSLYHRIQEVKSGAVIRVGHGSGSRSSEPAPDPNPTRPKPDRVRVQTLTCRP